MRAVQYVDQETGTAVGEVPDPSPGPGEVIVAVEACGLCGSDVHAVQNGQAAPGQILGHEFSGRIAALGSGVTGWAQGQPVAATPLGSCGNCRICARGLAFRCPAAGNIGITIPGAYAQYVAVPARQLVALPAELPVEIGCHAEPLSVASEAVKLARVGPGDPVLVYGVGPIGLYAIMALKLAGAGPIVGVGRSEGRRLAAAAAGADVVLDSREISVAEYAKQSGTLFAAVLECSAAPGAFTEALSVTEPGGTVVEVALSPETPAIPLFGILSEGQHIVGACAFSDQTYRESVAHLVAGRVPVDQLVSERVSLDDTPDALRRLQKPGTLVRIIAKPLPPGGTTPRTPRCISDEGEYIGYAIDLALLEGSLFVEEFAGKTAVVTGAGSGMGKAFALRWGAEGMNVVIGDIQADALAATVAELEAAGVPVLGLRTDVSKLSDIEALADAAEERFGKIHLVNNNAGVEGYLDGPIWAATGKDWDWTLSVNMMSVIYGVRTFVPRMLAHGEAGHVINTCSMTSVIAASNMYGITKHATLALTEVLSADLTAAGAPIGVTGICPGIIATNLFHGSRNRQEEVSNAGGMSSSGAALREQMHSTLAKGMPPSEVADKLVTAVRQNALYLLTDHEWDTRVVARHEAIMAGAVGPAATGMLDAEGVR